MLHAELFLLWEVCSICALTCHWVEGRGQAGRGALWVGQAGGTLSIVKTPAASCGVLIADTHLCVVRWQVGISFLSSPVCIQTTAPGKP